VSRASFWCLEDFRMNALRERIAAVHQDLTAAVCGSEIIYGLKAGAELAGRQARAEVEPMEPVAP